MNQQRWTDHWTVLHLASMLGHLGTLQILLEAGANTRMEDSQGRTPADIATRFGFPEAARLCCEANTERFRRERQIRRPDEDSSVKRRRTLEENIEEAVSPDPHRLETLQSPLQMSSVINSELKGSNLPTENCARGLGVNKKFGN